MVYEEVVEIVSGLQGKLIIPVCDVFRFNNSSKYLWKNKHSLRLSIVMSPMTAAVAFMDLCLMQQQQPQQMEVETLIMSRHCSTHLATSAKAG